MNRDNSEVGHDDSTGVVLSPPEGFTLLDRELGPWLKMLGPLYAKPDGDTLTLAMRVTSDHLNIMNIAHGGMLATLADIALAMTIARARNRTGAQVTAALNADFLSAARENDWIIAKTDLTKSGKRMAFASTMLSVEGRPILRATSIFCYIA